MEQKILGELKQIQDFPVNNLHGNRKVTHGTYFTIVVDGKTDISGTLN